PYATTHSYTLSLHDALPISQQQKDRSKVPQQRGNSSRHVGEAYRAGDQFVEHRRLKLQSEELEIMRIKLRIQMTLDGGEIDSIIDRKRTRLNSSHVAISYAV